MRQSRSLTAGGRETIPPTRPRTGVYARTAGSYVPKLTKKVFEKYGFSAATLLTDWAQIVGADLARYTQPERLKWPKPVEAWDDLPKSAAGRPGATLLLRVEGSRALDVQYKGRQVIERINAYFGYQAVTELRLVQGPVGTPRKPVNVLAGAPAGGHAAETLDPTLNSITDDSLRNALKRLQDGVRTWAATPGR
jgi:hypothetical protein